LCALVLSGAVAGCAAITGIDGYSKGDCSGGGDCDAGDVDSSVSDGRTRVPDATSETGSSSGEAASNDAGDSASDATADAAGDASDAGHDAKPDSPPDGGTDGASDASDAADAHDAANDANDASDAGDASESGCGPVDTPTNCGACGVACSTTNATSESCVTDAGAATCSYVCDPGFANCSKTPPNTGGCTTPTNTTNNCGGCGVACTLASASAATCNGVTCAYTCIANHSDCNYATAPDTDGCECDTPGCCAGGCQTTHADGTGQSYYDCNPSKTYTAVTATEACTAYAVSVGGTAANCSDGWNCNAGDPNQVCYGNTAGTNCQNYCWGYTGSQAGVLYTCACPYASAGSWD
jgi:hypothetical protein